MARRSSTASIGLGLPSACNRKFRNSVRKLMASAPKFYRHALSCDRVKIRSQTATKHLKIGSWKRLSKTRSQPLFLEQSQSPEERHGR
ncbi:hypothetical protein APS_2766 [Acetobacter pasteurianus subsp. pasteurianus LMG 1262 = NBRC 106471]|nr:hypothetical protein APS_2766 [Acetobacter pasteurianus subsp. pasteurianus LMG 1262 = NBRC 106471]